MAYSPDLIIEDDEYEEAAVQLKKFFGLLGAALEQYLVILANSYNNAISSGSVHDTLVAFADSFSYITPAIADLSECFPKIVDNFINEIDGADEYLYDMSICKEPRDFSNETYQFLCDCLDNPWCEVTDSFGDLMLGIIDKFCNIWDKAKSELHKCRRLLLDYNDTTFKDLSAIFDAAYSIASKYSISINAAVIDGDYYTSHFANADLTMCYVRDFLDEMAKIIDPSNGCFSEDYIFNSTYGIYSKMKRHLDATIAISRAHDIPNIIEVSDFVSQRWADSYFKGFVTPIGIYIADMGGYDAFKRVVFQMFDIAETTMVTCEDYSYYIKKQQLLNVLDEFVQNPNKFSESDEKETIEDFKTFYKYVKKYGDGIYEYLNTHRDSNGKLLLDGRTVEARKFREFLDSFGGAKYILNLGEDAADYFSRLFADYSKGIEVVDSFERNIPDDEEMKSIITEIRGLYNKEFGEWTKTAIQEYRKAGFDIAIKELGNGSSVISVLSEIRKGIDITGDITGLGPKAKAMSEALTYHSLESSSREAYRRSVEAFRAVQPDSDEYETFAKDVVNCFNLEKENLIRLYQAMIDSTPAGAKKEYFKYCLRELKTASMKDATEFELKSLESFT